MSSGASRSTAAWLWRWVERCWFAPVPAARLGAVRALVCAVALYDLWLYAPVVFSDAQLVSSGAPLRPWTPLYYVQVLGLQPIGSAAAELWFAIGTAALLAGMLGLFARSACAIGAVAFFVWTGLAYSFGKPHHDKVALAFALLALPFAQVGAAWSLDAWWRQRRQPTGERAAAAARDVAGLPIWLLQFSLAVGYCGAGTAKLLLGGPEWFNGYTLQGIMLGHDGAWSRTFAQSVFWCQVQSVGVVMVQVAFPLLFVFPALRWFLLPAATGFHLMTWQTMDTGPYMRVWLLLPVFLPLEQVPATLHRWLRRGPLPATLLVLAVTALAGLVGSIAAAVLPVAALWVVAAWLLVAFLRANPRPGC